MSHILRSTLDTRLMNDDSATPARTSFRISYAIVMISAVVVIVASYALTVQWNSEAVNSNHQGYRWPEHALISIGQVDHTSFDQLLGKYVNNEGLVNYRDWHQNAEDRKKLTDYLNKLSQAQPQTGTQNEQLAFWINAYNALTIQGILKEYPTTSIRNHTGVLGYNIWKDFPLLVGNQKYSLDAIEHKVLRPMGEPKIHFAIVCASISCPKLRNEAYVAGKLKTQLTHNATEFFSNPLNFQFDAASQKVKLSSILDWFGKDFGNTTQAQLQTILPYLPQHAQQAFAIDQKVSVSYLDYDWSLNAQHPIDPHPNE